MTILTTEERQRLCVAKFRDMSDDMLCEMPGTVMHLGSSYREVRRKLEVMTASFLKHAERMPLDVVKDIADDIARDMIASGAYTEAGLQEAIAYEIKRS